MRTSQRINPNSSYRSFLARLLAVVCLSVILLAGADESYAGEACEPAVAEIISIQGIIELRRASSTTWQAMTLHTAICPGDSVRARTHSRAAFLLSNASVLRLDQKTSMTFSKPEGQEKAGSLMELFSGAIHIITRTPKPFKVRTPFVNAGVDGTEFFVGVDETSTRLVIYEGKVTASNDQGSLVLEDHQAAIATRNTAPQRVTTINPTDAVQWALHYPVVIDYQLARLTDELALHPELRQSVELYRQGKTFEALSVLENISTTDFTVNLHLYRAGLLLAVGQAGEAGAAIGEILRVQPDNSEAHALLAMIAVVQNNKDQALQLATRAAALDRNSPAAKLALSYAQQAHFKIEDALESAQQAIAIDPDNALAWARLAKLQMSQGDLDRALETAQRAVSLNPDIARTKTVLGFSQLLQVRTKQAKAEFLQAIALDQADPMPRLGMGLALIREGEIEAGRVELEIAASLDPANSLIRSYLGKAYFEEKRYPLAGTQFDLAKEKDPQDPTPWFYDAIQKQTQNRPIEALMDLQKSIELNHNRAVYRSKFLLDQDEAARGSSLARIYDNLGFEKRALVETAKSLSIDPANHSSHRFLSDAYANIPRHEVARVSELLQAQLLQPINVNPVQPHLAVADLNIINNTGPTRAGFNEFAPLMERNKPQLVASGVAGSNSTFGNEATLSAVYDKASVSLGQYHFQSDGFRSNNDQKHNIYNAFVQYALTPKLNVQAEFRRRNSDHGDLLLDFNPSTYRQDRRQLDQDTARGGIRYSLSSKQDFLFSGIYYDRRENQVFPADPSIFTARSNLKDQGYQLEGQYIHRDKFVNVVTGAGTYQIDARHQCGGIAGIVCSSNIINFSRERENAYFYSNLNYFQNINATLGVSYDAFRDAVNQNFDAVNPKFGLQWDLTSAVRLRLAWFESVKSALIANQTLEPTQVAGFNQMFDDLNGTRSRRMGAGLDAALSKNLYAGMEASDRDLKVPYLNRDFRQFADEQQQERLYRSYLYWLPHAHWAVNGEFQYEQYDRAAVIVNDSNKPYEIHSLSAPLTINYFHPNGFFGKVGTTYLQQSLKRLPEAEPQFRDGNSDFVLLDAALGYRLPSRRGILSFEGRNLSDEQFYYRSYNFQFNEMNTSSRFIPTRTFFVRLTLNY